MQKYKGSDSINEVQDIPIRRKKWRVKISISKDEQKSINLEIDTTKVDEVFMFVEYDSQLDCQENKFVLEQPIIIKESETTTFKEIIDKWYLEHMPEVGHERQRNIKSRIHSMKPLYANNFSEIKLIDLQGYIDSLNVSTGTKKEYKSILNLIFNYGLKYEFIEKNPVQFIEVGKHEKVREASVFTEEEIRKLWKYKEMKYVDTILILIYTGLRINELLNLKKENVFIKERYMTGGSKTKAGKNRIIPIHKDIIGLIENRLNSSEEYLIEKSNEQIKYNSYIRHFKIVLEQLKLNEHRVHDTRHTFATLIGSSNANQSSITKIIGHSNFKMTEKIYIHKNKDDLVNAIDQISIENL